MHPATNRRRIRGGLIRGWVDPVHTTPLTLRSCDTRCDLPSLSLSACCCLLRAAQNATAAPPLTKARPVLMTIRRPATARTKPRPAGARARAQRPELLAHRGVMTAEVHRAAQAMARRMTQGRTRQQTALRAQERQLPSRATMETRATAETRPLAQIRALADHPAANAPTSVPSSTKISAKPGVASPSMAGDSKLSRGSSRLGAWESRNTLAAWMLMPPARERPCSSAMSGRTCGKRAVCR